MTTPPDPRGEHLPDDPLSPEEQSDALVSTYLDGEATAAERARVEGDPLLMARLDQFRSVHSALVRDMAAPARALDDLVATAVAASSNSPEASSTVPGRGDSVESDTDPRPTDAGADDHGEQPGFVVDLGAARARRRPPGWIGGVVAVAAALLLFIVAIPALLSGDDDEMSDIAASISDGADGARASREDGSLGDAESADAMEMFDAPVAGDALSGSAGASAEGPLVLVPLSEVPQAESPPFEDAVDDEDLATSLATPQLVELGRFPDRSAAQQTVTAAVVDAVERPFAGDIGTRTYGAPDSPVASCLGQPPVGAEGAGLDDPTTAVVFVGSFEQAGDGRYVVVTTQGEDADRANHARYRVLEVQAAACVLLGEQFL